jgi:hypothetical protein
MPSTLTCRGTRSKRTRGFCGRPERETLARLSDNLAVAGTRSSVQDDKRVFGLENPSIGAFAAEFPFRAQAPNGLTAFQTG